MPKQVLKIDQFHGGLNTFSDPRDIDDNQLSELQDASVSSIGRIVVAGGKSEISSIDSPSRGSVIRGYGLFTFSSDYDLDNENKETNFFIRYIKESNSWKVLPYNTSYNYSWQTIDPPTDSSISTNIDDIFTADPKIWDYKPPNAGHEGIEDHSSVQSYPSFFYIDGALRISDNAGYNSGTGVGNVGVPRAKPTVWLGFIQRNYFNGVGDYGQDGNNAAGMGALIKVFDDGPNEYGFPLEHKGWFAYKNNIKKPTNGRLFGNSDTEIDGANVLSKIVRKVPSTNVVIAGETYAGMNMANALSIHVRHSDGNFKRLLNDRGQNPSLEWTYDGVTAIALDYHPNSAGDFGWETMGNNSSNPGNPRFNDSNWNDYIPAIPGIAGGVEGFRHNQWMHHTPRNVHAAERTAIALYIYDHSHTKQDFVVHEIQVSGGNGTDPNMPTDDHFFGDNPLDDVFGSETTANGATHPKVYIYDTDNKGENIYQSEINTRGNNDFTYGMGESPESWWRWSVSSRSSPRIINDLTGDLSYVQFGASSALYWKVRVPDQTAMNMHMASGSSNDRGHYRFAPVKVRAYYAIANLTGVPEITTVENEKVLYDTSEMQLNQPGGYTPGNLDDGGVRNAFYEWTIDFGDGTWAAGEWKVLSLSLSDALKVGAIEPNFPILRTEILFGVHGTYNGNVWYNSPSPLHWMDFYMGEEQEQWEDTINSGLRSWGYSYIYDGAQESGVMKFPNKVNLNKNGFPLGITAYHNGQVGHNQGGTSDEPGDQSFRNGRSNYRITGSNIYFYDKDDTPFKIAECDFEKGLKKYNASDFPDNSEWSEIAKTWINEGTPDLPEFIEECLQWNKGGNRCLVSVEVPNPDYIPPTNHKANVRRTNTIYLQNMPLFFSYDGEHGYSESEGSDNSYRASFGHVSLNDRKLYISKIFQNKNDGRGTTWHRDLMIGTSPGEYDIYPTKSNDIVVASEDGDSIVAITSYADRIMQFKKNVMYLINVTKSAEFLEDTFRGKGVLHPGAVCKTDFGIAWANANGCFFYDGRQVQNLSDMKISDSDWSGHMDTNSQVGFHPNSRKIIVTGGGSNNRNAYVFDLVLKSWAYMKQVFDDFGKTNFVVDANQELVWMENADSSQFLKWTESPVATGNFLVETKDIDFGHPGVRKKIYRVYVTYKGSSGGGSPQTNVIVDYDTNGGNTFNYDFENGTNFTSNELDASNVWAVAELKPDTSSEAKNVKSFKLRFEAQTSQEVPVNFEINDISIVYRLKHIK